MRCSYCYGHGHNKMGCPTAMKTAATVLPQWEEWQKMDHDTETCRNSLWRAKKHFDWRYSEMEAIEIWQAKQKRSKKEKKCNFCGETGHNKRTCPKLKATKQMLHKAELGFRASVVAGLKETGQGIGAIVSGLREYWNPATRGWVTENSIGLVIGHRWDRLELLDKRHLGELFTQEVVGSQFIKVRWNNGDVELIHSLVPLSLGDKPLFYRNWQVEKLTIASKSDKLQIPEGYTTPAFDSDILKGRKARNHSHFKYVVDERLNHLVKIGQKMSSTS